MNSSKIPTHLYLRLVGLVTGAFMLVGCTSSGNGSFDSAFCLKDITSASSGYAGGSGSSSAPYLICKASELAHLMATSSDWSANFKLLSNVDLSTISSQNPIGQMQITNAGTIVSSTPFTGTFDGGGYTISGLSINQSSNYEYTAGLFGYLDNATVQNLTLSSASVVGQNYSGILVGVSQDSTLSNVSVTGTISYPSSPSEAGSCVGGVIGEYIVDDGSSRVMSGITATLTASANDLYGSFIGMINLSANSSLEVKSNSVTSTFTQISGGGNTYSGFIGYEKSASSTLNAHDNSVNSTLTATANGAFSGGFLGTLSCTSCSTTFDHNSVQLNWSNPAAFNGGYVGGFYGIGQPGGTGSVLNFTRNIVTGSMTFPAGTNNRGGLGGFAGYLGFGNATTGEIENNASQVNLTIQSTGSTSVSTFIGYLAVTGTAAVTWENNYAVGNNNVTSPGANQGGLIGNLNLTGTLTTNSTNSYYSSDDFAAGVGNIANPSYISGLTRAQMQVETNFVGWDFTSIWNIVSGGYPFLR